MTIDWETRFRGTLNAAIEHGSHVTQPDPLRVTKLRISSFPFCARDWLLALPTRTAPRLRSTVAEEWFLHMGTTAHDVLQQSVATTELPMSALLIQDWICTECNERHRFQPRPGKCSFCGHATLKHAETRLHYGPHVIGHMDGCLAYPHKKSAAYSKDWYHVPLDYKTTTSKAVEGNAPTLPYASNVEQLSTYTAILHKYGYNTPGCVLIYVPRDNPHAWIPKFVPYDAETLSRVDTYVKHYTQARAVKSVKDARKLPPVATEDFDRHCRYCKFKPLCKAELADPKVLDTYYEKSIDVLQTRLTLPDFSL